MIKTIAWAGLACRIKNSVPVLSQPHQLDVIEKHTKNNQPPWRRWRPIVGEMTTVPPRTANSEHNNRRCCCWPCWCVGKGVDKRQSSGWLMRVHVVVVVVVIVVVATTMTRRNNQQTGWLLLCCCCWWCVGRQCWQHAIVVPPTNNNNNTNELWLRFVLAHHSRTSCTKKAFLISNATCMLILAMRNSQLVNYIWCHPDQHSHVE